MVFGKDNEPEISLKLGDKDISYCEAHDHVGTLSQLLVRQCWNTLRNVLLIVTAPNAICGIGSINAPVMPQSGSKLYWSTCIPKLLYGMEIMPVPDPAVQAMESYHADAAKVLQGLPNQTCNLGAIGLLG